MKTLSRRGWLTAVGVAGAGTCACGLVASRATFTERGRTPALPAEAYVFEGQILTVALDKVPALGVVGGSVKLIDARLRTPILIARSGPTDYRVVSLLCPHRGVEVEYRHPKRHFRCASLGHSTFNEEGTRLKGFAKQGLIRYAVAIDPAGTKRLLISG